MNNATLAHKFTMKIRQAGIALATLTVLAVATVEAASAAAIRQGLPGTFNQLARNDDGSTGLVNIGFTANFFGVAANQLYVNNNGNITFDAALRIYTPFNLTSTARKIIAPFFADVDTRNLASAVTTYGQTIVNGRNAFVVNWDGVGYFDTKADKLNEFQLVLIDRSDIGVGDFDIEFNYDQIQWETGDESRGRNGLGGNSARVGFSNGTGAPGTFFELPGSAVNGAFLDGGANALISNRLNTNVDGRYVFTARNGSVVTPPTSVPEPTTIIGLLTISALGAGTLQKRKQPQRATAKA